MSAPEIRKEFSPLQLYRRECAPELPSVLLSDSFGVVQHQPTAISEEIQSLFPSSAGNPSIEFTPGECTRVQENPLRVGVVLSGGQAPGGHNVIGGLFDYIKRVNGNSALFGFLNGPHGVYTGNYFEVTSERLNLYRNTGGFDMLGSGRHKIETEEQLSGAKKVCEDLQLNGLVVIGGDDSNTNAAILAEYFAKNNCKTNVIGCPKTIDGDLKNQYIPISFGFDTACKIFSELVGNVAIDTLSSQKYYHFVRLMGRSASNIALEVALQTHPNVCFIAEEVREKRQSLIELTQYLVDIVKKRAEQNKNYGVILVPEGLIEFIPEFEDLMRELNDLLAHENQETSESAIINGLSEKNRTLFCYLPSQIKKQLLLDRDPHGNVQVTKIETEKLLAYTLQSELQKATNENSYHGSFNPQFHSFGYEGRCGLPSIFDSTYCYALGYNAGALIASGFTSLMSSVTDLFKGISEWKCGGVPVTMMMQLEKRKGKLKPVIKKALVELDGHPFKVFETYRDHWAFCDVYRCPGPIQFDGVSSGDISLTLLYETNMEAYQAALDGVSTFTENKENIEFEQKGNFLFRSNLEREFMSPLQVSRLNYSPQIPPILNEIENVSISYGESTRCLFAHDQTLLQKLFPCTYGSPFIQIVQEECKNIENKNESFKIGVVFCGRPAPGGHNIVTGIVDALSALGGTCLGYVGGIKGLISHQSVVLTQNLVNDYRNQGGFHLLGRSRDLLNSNEEFEAIQETCERDALDGLILIGARRTHSYASYLAEFLKSNNVSTCIVAIPCGIEADMRCRFIETSVGFDTASKINSELVGNTAIDGASARKYYYFMRMMGRGVSQLAAEVFSQANPNIIIFTEEILAQRKSLYDVVSQLADVISARAQQNKNFGTVIIPEGIITAVPELHALISEIDKCYSKHPNPKSLTAQEIQSSISPWSQSLLALMPKYIQDEFFFPKASDNQTRITQIEIEKLLAFLVENELEKRQKEGTYTQKFGVVCSFLGYQSRGSLPSNFDCDFGYSLGITSVVLAKNRCHGYVPILTGLKNDISSWQVGGVPLTCLLVADGVEKFENGQIRPRIPPSAIDFSDQMVQFLQARDQTNDCYTNPGPIQFNSNVAALKTKTVLHTHFNYLEEFQSMRDIFNEVLSECRPGCSVESLKTTSLSLLTLKNILKMMAHQSQKEQSISHIDSL